MASNPFDKLNPQYWPSLPDDIDPKLRTALMQVFNAIDNHRKAFAALKSQQTTTQTQTQTIVQTFQSGGNGNVFGPSSSTPGDAAVFADNSGKQLSDVGYPPVSAAQVQNESMFYADDTGGAANTYVAVLSPVVTTYVEGLRVALKIAHTSTGASTLDAGGGAVTIKKLTTTGLADIAASDLQAGDIYIFRYDGTFWQVQVAGGGGGGLNGVVVKTTNYTAQSTDDGKMIVLNGNALTLTLPASPPSATWTILATNIDSTVATIARNGRNIDGAASNLSLYKYEGLVISTDATDYFTDRGTQQEIGGVPFNFTSWPQDGVLWQYQASTGKMEQVWVYQKMQGGTAGAPSANQPMLWANVIQPITFAADFAGSEGNIDPSVGTNPTATVTLTVKKWVSGVATTIGTISISTSGVFTFATTSHAAQSAGTGDLIAVYNQNPADATLAYPTFTLAAYLGSTAPTNPTPSGGAVTGPVSSVNNDIALFDGTPGNVIKDSGVQISTDGTMAADSDSLVPTQKAVVTYVGTPLGKLLEQHTVSGAASIDFTTGMSSAYDEYILDLHNVTLSTAGTALLQFSTNGGSSYDTTAANYFTGFLLRQMDGTFNSSGNSSSAAGVVAINNVNTTQPGVSGRYVIYNPSGSYKQVTFQYTTFDSGNNYYSYTGAGVEKVTTQATAARLIAVTGGVTISGTVRLYGVAK